jgi:putative flippase GtrA
MRIRVLQHGLFESLSIAALSDGNYMSGFVNLAISYAFFALIAIVSNIGAQDLVIRVYDGAFNVLLSVVVGTGVGLVVKYVLDKRYIFRFRARDITHDTTTFVLYAVMGMATTVVFWGFEFCFHFFFASKEMRYLGGIIGLTIGYVTKYHLDKRFTFSKRIS